MRLLSTILAALFLINISFPQTRDKITGWLHTSGNLILDSNNNIIRLTGINSTGMEWGAGHAWNQNASPGCSDQYGCYQTPLEQKLPQEFDDIKACGFNFVRLLISWANLEPNIPVDSSGVIVHHWNEAYVDSLDKIVSEFSSRGIAIILSMHQWTWSPAFKDSSGSHGLGMPVWLYSNQASITQSGAIQQFFIKDTLILPGYTVQQGYLDAWREVLGRYVNDPTIIGVDLFNEPPDQFSFSLKKYYDTLGTAIHSINPNLLLVFQDGVNGKFKLTGNPGLPNSIYSFHMYPKAWLMAGANQPSAEAQMQSHFDTARAWNVPMILGEIGQFGFADTLGWQADMKMLFDFCKVNDVSWAFYAYQHWTHPLVNNGQLNDSLVQTLQEGMDSLTTGIAEESNQPVLFKLYQNYPNPFNPATTIKYSVEKESYVSIKVFDVLGNEILSLVDGIKSPGDYDVKLNTGRLGSGVYFYRMEAEDRSGEKDDFIQTKKFIVLK